MIYLYADINDNKAAVEGMDGVELDGRHLAVNISTQPSSQKGGPARSHDGNRGGGGGGGGRRDFNEDPASKIYVGQLSYDTPDNSLEDAFMEFGPVVSAQVAKVGSL